MIYSNVILEMGVEKDGEYFSVSWEQGDIDHILIDKNMWHNSYEFFVPPGQPLYPGSRVKFGPYEMEFIGESIDERRYIFNLVFKDQKKSKYKIKRNENKWTKIS